MDIFTASTLYMLGFFTNSKLTQAVKGKCKEWHHAVMVLIG